MFSRPLLNNDPAFATKIPDPANPNFRMADYGYGKRQARVFQLQKDGPIHSVLEFKVNSYMRLRTHKEYYEADNSDIIGSDVQETSIYIHAKKYGLRTPEEFALSLTQHFLDEFDLAAASNVTVENVNWDRLGVHEKEGYYKNTAHNHAFMQNNNGQRICEVVRRRDEPKPLLISGITGMRMVKTAKSPFTGYVKGQLFTEGDNPDRILCFELNAKWQYARTDGINFADHWFKVRELILRTIVGDPQVGVVTTSVQYIAYKVEQAILKEMPEICSVSVQLPNFPHTPFNYSRFPPFDSKVDVIICDPKDAPISIGYAQLDRKENGVK